MNANIPAGYKLTEVGVIPVDWEASTVGAQIEFQGGSQPEKSVFSNSMRPGFIRLIQIRDYKSDRFEVFAPVALLRRFCDENDIMIGRYGPPVFQILRGLSGAYNVALIKAIPCNGFDREFAYHFLKQDTLFEFIEKLSRRSSGQTGVDISELRQYPLPLPPLPEQRAIAAALSDVDTLLTKLNELIAKKRDLKQATMQQLLTGKTRLKGFSGDWEVKKLGEIAEIIGGSTPSSFNANYWNGTINWFTPTEIGNYKYTFESVRKITKEGFNNCASKILPIGAILLTTRAAIGDLSILMCEGCTNQGFQSLVVKDGYCNEYIYYLMQTLKNELIKNASGSTFLEVSPNKIKNIKTQLPKLKEQTAIAEILSDMDAEITGLEARRDKTRLLKQGMMQELLTGRIRLV